MEKQTERLRQEAGSTEELLLPTKVPADQDPFAAAALSHYCLAVFNLNEFIYVD